MKRNFSATAVIGSLFLSLLMLTFCSPNQKKTEVAKAEVPRSTNYQDLVSLCAEFREFQKPIFVEGVPDYTKAAMELQRQGLEKLKSRLAAIDGSSWPVSQQVDYHVVRAEMNGLDFDHRVLRPWSRNPCFYTVIETGPTDVPAKEGPVNYGTLLIWKYKFPLADKDVAEFRMKLQAVPKMLEQAKVNLTEEAKDLWFLAIRKKKDESAALSNLAKLLAEHHPDLAPDAEKAKTAADDFRAWVEKKQSTMTARSGIGIENYNWYMKNVHLNPYTWEDQLVIIQRELERALAGLKLEEHRNRKLPKLEAPATEEEYRRRFNEAVDYFIEFLRKEEIFTVPDYMSDSLKRPVVIGERSLKEGSFIPPGSFRDFFNKVDYYDPLPMRCHGTHWFDWARIVYEPHPSPIRRVPLLYSIWDSRAEGLATGMEEMMLHAGLYDKGSPRVRELVYILLANRCARAMGDLKMHSNEFTLEDAVDYGSKWTPYNWFPKEGNSVWVDASLYLNQPGYGTSYVVGKVHIEKLIAECAQLMGEKFTLKKWFDDFHATGQVPMSLIRWEMTGLTDEIKKLW
jgi:hypothetical protein